MSEQASVPKEPTIKASSVNVATSNDQKLVTEHNKNLEAASSENVSTETPADANEQVAPSVSTKGTTEPIDAASLQSKTPQAEKDLHARQDANEDAPLPTLDDFMAVKDGGTPFAPKGEKKDEKKEQEKGQTTVAAKPAEKETKVDDKPTQQDGKTVGRDYSGLPEEEQKILRSTSNEAFAYLKPVLLERGKLKEILSKKDQEIANLKVGKQMLPDNYYEHPQAFVLTPEYNSAIKDLNYASAIEQHWKEQYSNIERGSKWCEIDIDQKTGRLVLGPEREATIEDKADVLSYIHHSANQINRIRGQVSQIQGGFQARFQQAAKIIQDAEKQHLSAYDDPNHPMVKEGVLKSMMDNIPSEFRSSPLASILAKTATGFIQVGRLLQMEQAKNAELMKKLEAKGDVSLKPRTTQPTEAEMAVSTSTNGKAAEPEITMDDFARAKEGY